MLACGLFAKKDYLNVSHLSKFDIFYSMLEGDRIDPGSFLFNQFYSVATSSAHRIVIGALITPITGFGGVEPNPDDKVLGSKQLNSAAFEQIKIYKVDGRRIRWIYPGN